jgi:hypothetical protein
MTGLQVDTDSATLHAALGEVINEHLHPTPDPQPEPIEVFTLPEASNSEPKPPAVLASDGPGVVVDRAALEMLRQRATASDRTMLAIGKLVGITATDEQTVVAAVTEALAEAAVLLRRPDLRPVCDGRVRRCAHRPIRGAQRGHRERRSHGRRCDQHAHRRLGQRHAQHGEGHGRVEPQRDLERSGSGLASG